MNASKLFATIAAIAFAGGAFAADVPAANATVTTAAANAAQVSAAAQSVAAAAAKQAHRDKVRAEAEEAARNRRSTEASQFDWFMK
jgi:hypothetical protein